jgi:aminoglycoside phosphotransferase (APT) family kinase protein
VSVGDVDMCELVELLGAEPVEEAAGPQGASGGKLRYFSAGSQRAVAKHATPLERRVIELLQSQGAAVPETRIPDATSPGRSWIYQRFAQDRPADRHQSDVSSPLTVSIAAGLAHLHAANLGRCPDWLPRVEANPRQELYLDAWSREWAKNMANDEDFAATYGHHTDALHSSQSHLLGVIDDLCAEGSLCTLINSDLTPAHIRVGPDGGAVFIDWEQACYGPLFIDLVNYFTAETGGVYRQALADMGVQVEEQRFAELFSECGRWMGLRYLEVGLWAWQLPRDDPSMEQKRKELHHFFSFCLDLALKGR